MLSLFSCYKKPRSLLISLMQRYGRWLPDQIYLKWLFWLKMGKRLDLGAPKTFSEKLQWLKLYNRKPEYTTMVDKYSVKNHVATIIGSEYVIPTLCVWDKPEDIEWDKLPDKFVLKTTHGGGSAGVVICRNKAIFDRKMAVDKLKKSLMQDIYKSLREWPYKNVPKRVMAEQYIEPQPGVKDLPDYKWYCFDGEPRYCQVIQDRTTNETIDFFDTNWRHQEFIGLNPSARFATVEPTKPVNLETQVNVARQLSKGFPFVRIDLYEVKGRVYFGEITFYPMSGFGIFCPEKYNDLLGSMLTLPN